MQHSTIRKAVCGILAALLITAVPLTALADDQVDPAAGSTPPSAETTVITPSPSPAATPPSPAASPTPTPTASPSPAVETSKSAEQPATVVTPSPAPSPSPGPTTSSNLQVGNNINSNATSGDATVTENRDAGNAKTGSAGATATVLNVANANGAKAGNFQTFNCDITRDLQQNIIIDPSTLLPLPECTDGGVRNGSPLQQSAVPAASGSLQNGSSLVHILNDIVLSAASGNASVDHNRDGGNATTGDATALANVVNIANSAISSKNSFLGVINIYGQLKGDILVPQSFVDSLIGSNGMGSGAVNNTNISNNINASAASGSATVADNRDGGNAATGDAKTSLTVLNLTGQEVVAKNSLLVFVNVLGKWMGMIVPAPGTNTAMLGSGLQGGQSLLSSASAGHQTGQDNTTNITNNITVNAQSGDANVSDNRTGGNATSGNAKAGVNLLNITDSNFWLEDWFGALFINVLGSWLGDFDIQQNAPATSGDTGSSQTPPVQDVKVYQFTAPASVKLAGTGNDSRVQTAVASNTGYVTDNAAFTNVPVGKVLGSSTVIDKQFDKHSARTRTKFDFFITAAVIAALIMLTAVVTSVIRRYFAA